MEHDGGLASTSASLLPLSEISDVYENVLAALQNAYLYVESKQSFRYKSALLFNNSRLRKQYEAFRANRRDAGYSEEELKEDYGFLLFDDLNKATQLGETGVLTGNTTCKSLGDPSKGAYILKYSDCLDSDQWYCRKYGFIAVIRLTKGRIKKVPENYTQSCIAPSLGFDCHESQQLTEVSASTSSFLAFERSQHYLYELTPDGRGETTRCPRHACPFALVSFSYDNTKAAISESQRKMEKNTNLLNYIVWRGELHISSNVYHVGLKSTSGASSPIKLPAVMKVDQAVSMINLQQFAPKAVFETCFSGEVSLDGICCSVHEFVSINKEDSSLAVLIQELKDKDLGLIVQLNDSGFLVLLHSCNFAKHNGTGASVTEALQAMFLFPGSRAIQKDIKGGHEESWISSEILQVLPALNCADTEVQKTSRDQSDELCGQFVQNLKKYVALNNPELAISPSRQISTFSKDCNVHDSLNYICPRPKWTNRIWQGLRSYLSHPASFQLPVHRVTEHLAAGNRLHREGLDNEDHFCLSPLEKAPGTACSSGPELLSKSTAHNETLVSVQIVSEVSESLRKVNPNKGSVNPGLAMATNIIEQAKSIFNSPASNPPTELVVSITSAEETTTDKDNSLSVSNAMPLTKHCEMELSNSLTAKLQLPSLGGQNRVYDEATDSPNLNNPTKRPRGRPKGKRKIPPISTSENQDEFSQNGAIINPPKTDQRKLRMGRRNGIKLSYVYKKISKSKLPREIKIKQNKRRKMAEFISTESKTGFLTRNMERWELKPIITECGRMLVPHGSTGGAVQIDGAKSKREVTDLQELPDEMIVKRSEEALHLVGTEHEPGAETLAVDTISSINVGRQHHNTDVLASTHSDDNSRQHDGRKGSSTGAPEFMDPYIERMAEADDTDCLPSTSSQVKYRKKSKVIIGKLKKLFLRKNGRNTLPILVDSILPVDAESTGPMSNKAELDGRMLQADGSITRCQDSREEKGDVLRTLTQDLQFAQALGLMLKVSDKIQETQNPNTWQKKHSSSTEGPFIPTAVEPAQLLQMHPSTIQKTKRRLRMHTPSSSSRRKYKVCSRSTSFEKNLKESFGSTGQSINALKLLADLALGASNDPLSQEIDPSLMTRLDPSSDVDDLLKDGTNPEKPLVPHASLRQPADSPILPSNRSSREGLVGSEDVVDLIAEEHAYSLLNESSSSPDGTQQHRLDLCSHGSPRWCDEPREGTSRHDCPIDVDEDALLSRRFKRSRMFSEKDGFITITRRWKEIYDFELDGKFTNHPKEKTINRSLHGSWDLTLEDNGGEARLIFHLRIGLFYSRSTPRSIDSSHLDSKENDYAETCSKVGDDTIPVDETRSATPVSVGITEPRDLELGDRDDPVLNRGSEVLDLSMKRQDVTDTGDISVCFRGTNAMETSQDFAAEAEIRDDVAGQCQVKYQSPQAHRSVELNLALSESDDDDFIVQSTNESVGMNQQNAGQLETPISDDVTCYSLCKDMTTLIIQPQIVDTKGSVLPLPQGSDIGTAGMGDRKKNQGDVDVEVVPQIIISGDTPETMSIAEDLNSQCGHVAGDVEYDGNESKHEDCQSDADSSLPVTDDKEPTPGDKPQRRDTTKAVNPQENKSQSTEVNSNVLAHVSNKNKSKGGPSHLGVEEDMHLKQKPSFDEHGSNEGDDPVARVSSKSPLTQRYDVGDMKDASVDWTLKGQCLKANASVAEEVVQAQDLHVEFDETFKIAEEKVVGDAKTETVSEQDTESKSDKDFTPIQDGFVGESQTQMMPDSCVTSCNHQGQDNKSVEWKHILDSKAVSQRSTRSSQDETKRLLQDTSEKPLFEKKDSKQLETSPQVLLSVEDHAVEILKVSKETMLDASVYHTSPEDGGKVLMIENVISVFQLSDSEQKLSVKQSEFDERCPTQTRDEKPYGNVHSLEPSICKEVCKGLAEKGHSTNSSPTHEPSEQKLDNCDGHGSHGKELNGEPELKTLGDEDTRRELCQDNHTYKSRSLKTTEQSPSLDQNPTPCMTSMATVFCPINTSNSYVNEENTSNVNPGIAPAFAKQSLLKRKGFPVEKTLFNLFLHPKKMNNGQELCETAVKHMLGHELHSCSHRPVVAVKPSKTDSRADYYQTATYNTPAQSDENAFENLWRHNKMTTTHSHDSSAPSLSVLDPKGLGEDASPSTSSLKYTNYDFTEKVSNSFEQLPEMCTDSELTRFSMEQEFLIFSEEMKLLLNVSKGSPINSPNKQFKFSSPSYATARFPSPQELVNSVDHLQRRPSRTDQTINLGMPESGTEEMTGEQILDLHKSSPKKGDPEGNAAFSDMVAECARSYHATMDSICAGEGYSKCASTNNVCSSGQMGSGMFYGWHQGLHLAVRQSFKTKLRFYILVTSDDAFFEETKALLTADGHTEVQPAHFFSDEGKPLSSLLLVVLKNEDIAKHICEVPHLLDLKKSPHALFAGIDKPNDIANLTHQDLFKRGGFIMLEETALAVLSLCKMKALLDFLQDLNKNGTWKWMLHYRDSRRFKENARFSGEEMEKKDLMQFCQEAGIVEVLPYHECDLMSREHPNYLSCLLQLQIHNISARFPVFVTESTDDHTFGKNGILTMNIKSLLMYIEREKCALSAAILNCS